MPQKFICSTAFNCTITVRYDSPGGRNHYEQSKSFSLNECIAIYDKFSLSNSHNKNSFAYQQRKAMSNALRFDVMKRDGFKCQLCGRTQKDGVTLEVDHVFPVAKGGLTVMSNLQTLCKDCNRGKGTKSIN